MKWPVAKPSNLSAQMLLPQKQKELPMQNAFIPLADDKLEGAEEIGAFMGLKARQVYHLKDRLPVFQIGAKLYARKSTIMEWIQKQECK